MSSIASNLTEITFLDVRCLTDELFSGFSRLESLCIQRCSHAGGRLTARALINIPTSAPLTRLCVLTSTEILQGEPDAFASIGATLRFLELVNVMIEQPRLSSLTAVETLIIVNSGHRFRDCSSFCEMAKLQNFEIEQSDRYDMIATDGSAMQHALTGNGPWSNVWPN